jgi:sugar O-acyltransferase (sialic acid O-acetyltransferase NeuD family)
MMALLAKGGPREFLVFDDLLAAVDGEARPFAAWESADLSDREVYLALGYKHLDVKERILERLETKGLRLPTYFDVAASREPSSTMGGASFVLAGCNLDVRAVIGRGVYLNPGCLIAHDTRVGDCCFFGAGVVVSANVSIGRRCFFGSGVTISSHVTIGDDAKIGVGSVVTADVPDGASVFGNPARLVPGGLRLT